MEKAIDEEKVWLTEAAREAAKPGDVVAPSNLVSYIAGLENPLVTLQDLEQANLLFAAFREDFGFINRPQYARVAIQPDEMTGYAALIRWLVQELRGWKRAEDGESRKLVAILVAAQSCDFQNGLCELLPDEIGNNVDFLERMKEMVASFSVTFTARGPNVPIWESEAVEKFKQADQDGDWAGIIEGWQKFPPSFSNTLQVQSVRFLYRYSLDRLAQALANIRQTAIAMHVAGALSIEQRLHLALASDSPYVQLAAVYRTLTDDRRLRHLGSDRSDLLTDLLLKVAADNSRWAAWMRIFSTYPNRFPTLLKPLGRALAQAPPAAIGPYVNSIWLIPAQTHADLGRNFVAECLREFRAYASPERRALLWSTAHERWLNWNFNRAEPNQHLTEICWSNLDYAVIGYAVECMDGAGRKAIGDAIFLEISTLEDVWRASLTDVVSEWNRLLSKFQPYARALVVVASDEDWLTQNRTYWPFDNDKNRYVMMKFNVM